MTTLKYNNAPDIMNCNADECSFNHAIKCAGDTRLIKPCGPGYTQDLNWPGGGMPYYKMAPGNACWPGEWKRVCRRLPPHDDYWNPLRTSLISETGPPNGYTPANIQKANRCCSNVAASNGEKEECGELLWKGTGPKPAMCGSILKRWCELDENKTNSTCFETVASDKGIDFFAMFTVFIIIAVFGLGGFAYLRTGGVFKAAEKGMSDITKEDDDDYDQDLKLKLALGCGIGIVGGYYGYYLPEKQKN